MRVLRLFAILMVAPGALLAQDTTAVQPAAVLPVTVGVTTGSMTFADRRVQRGISGVLRWHPERWMSLAASPTYARVNFPLSLGGGSVGGLTDLPIELGLEHGFEGHWSPAVGMSLGTTIPVGDEQVGFGSGSMGANIAAGVGLSPLDELFLHVGAGKSLTDYSMFGALGASEAVWGEAEVSYHVFQHLDATVGFDGDFSSSDSLGTPRAVALSFAAELGGPYTLTVSGGHGVSGPAARWTFALGFGTDFAGFQAIGSSSIQRLMRSGGGSSHRGPGSGTPGSGHGHGP